MVVVDIEVDRFLRDDLVNFRGEPAPITCVGVELVTSLNGDFSILRDELNRSILKRKDNNDKILDTNDETFVNWMRVFFVRVCVRMCVCVCV
jgi:hypothetical protein